MIAGLQQPIDYMAASRQIDPIGSLMQGLKAGMTLRGMAQDQQLRQQAMDIEQEKLLNKRLEDEQLQMRTEAFQNAVRIGDGRGIISAIAGDKRFEEAGKLYFSNIPKEQKDNEVRRLSQTYMLVANGQTDAAIKSIEDDREASLKAGEDVAEHDQLIKSLKDGDSASVKGRLIAGIAMGDIDAAKKIAELPYAEQAARVDLQGKASVIDERAARLGLDRDKLQSDVEMKLMEVGAASKKLPDSAYKLVNDAVTASVADQEGASRMLELAGKIESAGGGLGVGTKASEWFSKATGRQDEWTALRNEYTRLRFQQIIKQLPPGPATDRDIELASQGFPDETANAKTIGNFLRHMARLQQYSAAAKAAEADWVGENGSLGRAKNDFEIGGVKVAAGTTYRDYAKSRVAETQKEIAANQGAAATQQRSYMKWANP